jgi:hypothetical protein
MISFRVFAQRLISNGILAGQTINVAKTGIVSYICLLNILTHSPSRQRGGGMGEAQESPRGSKKMLLRAKKQQQEGQHGTKRGPKESRKSPREAQGSLKQGPNEAQKAIQELKEAKDGPR